MAVFPDRIVLKNSTDADAAIRSAIGSGGSDEITLGEVVVGLAAGSVTFYAKDSNGDIQTIGQNDAAVVIVSSTTPTVDNQGNPLSDGNIWFNPTTEVLSIYSSGAWVAVSGGGGGADAMTTDGDMLFHNGVETQRLPIGGPDKILTSVGGRPTWTTLGDSAAAPTVTGVYLDATSDSDTIWTGQLPAGGAGDTMVAVIMYRVGGGGITAPPGWNYVNAYAASGVFNTTDQQMLLLYVKTRDGSEPAEATWANNTAARIAGCIYNIAGPVNLLAVDQATASGSNDVSIVTATGTIPLLHLNFSHAVLAASPSTLDHSGTGITAVPDQGGATEHLRLATSYISTDGVTVTSQCNASGSTGDPNHGIFTLAIGEYTTALSIDKLTDVDTSTTPPTDGDVLVWDSTAPGNWVPQAPATGGGTETGRGDGGDFATGTVEASFVFGVYGGGDFDAGSSATTAAVPFAHAYIDSNNISSTTAHVGMSSAAHVYVASTDSYIDFTFDTARADTNYSVLHSGEAGWNVLEVESKTTAGFRISFYDEATGDPLTTGAVGIGAPVITVYDSDPTVTINSTDGVDLPVEYLGGDEGPDGGAF